MILLSEGAKIGLIVGVSVGAIFIVALTIILYLFIFSKLRYKKQIKDLGKKFSFSDALLVGQDSQYVHRLEIVSRTNLLYVDKYETFSTRFKELYDNDDKFAESMLKQLNSLVKNNQYHQIKSVINTAKNAIDSFELKVNAFDKDLYEVIKLEDDARAEIFKLKEKYRIAKQSFYVVSNDIELVSQSYQKAFDKLDKCFTDIETYIDAANYDECAKNIPIIDKVIDSLGNSLNEMPNICALLQNVIPNKIRQLSDQYKQVEREGIPLFHLCFKSTVELWNLKIKEMKKKAQALDIKGMADVCYSIEQKIDEVNTQLFKEKEKRSEFEEKYEPLYRDVIKIENEFVKICSYIPKIKSVYSINDDELTKINELRDKVNLMSNYKRILEGFMHSGTKQPYSLLMDKLNDLGAAFDDVNTSINDFKCYIETLKSSAEEAHQMIRVYFYRAKQVEAKLRLLNISSLHEAYNVQLDSVYVLLNDLNDLLEATPIDIGSVTEQLERLKNLANVLFEDIEHKFNSAKLAESAIVYANRDRYHQNDVDQQLSQLEKEFFMGDFDKVYTNASAIYKRSHIEDNTNA